MKKLTRLSDYQPFSHRVVSVELTFWLHPSATRVDSRLRFEPVRPNADLRLDGRALKLLWAKIDGHACSVSPDGEGLTIPAQRLPAGPFTWESAVEINPSANTALEGLYLSKGMFCTQCEAEGFRRITFYPDRPDVMAPFRVRIFSDLPVRLSNGNPVAQGPGFTEWYDPWPKPSYLFALVSGDLVASRDRFTTRSGKTVALALWTRPGDEDKTDFALDALKRAMRWDEEVYGREYDLDVFNMVAVDDFNMGAMENKGLNIFNSKFVLASPETATDSFYAAVERIVAHEYFHNWTGNRITLRDWFQLSLKEGLTVYRDQQFMADQRGAAVERIRQIETLRARQFPEDEGPLAHPVRPTEYQAIDNFYTATVYEKGAEVIRMLALIVGEANYHRAVTLFFERHDGKACTIEDWLKAFEDATGRDLSQFKLWYEQAGTPRLHVSEAWDGETFRLIFRQRLPPTPSQTQKAPMLIPIAFGLIGPDGREVAPTQVLGLDRAELAVAFRGLAARPVPSLLRGGSAPVILEHEAQPEALAHLMRYDTDPVARWDAGQRLALIALSALANGQADLDAPAVAAWIAARAPFLHENGLDPNYRALMLAVPSEAAVAAHSARLGHTPDPERIHSAREAALEAIAKRFAAEFQALLHAYAPRAPFRPDPASAGRRALFAVALSFVTRIDGGRIARTAFAEADNMTDTLAALSALLSIGAGEHELTAFYTRWRHERLVIDHWFALQARLAKPAQAVERVRELAAHPDFDWANPNRFRALFGAFAENHAGFHRADGQGYALFADWLIRLDARNPQFAARMSAAFETWHRYDATRQAHARAALERMRAQPQLSRNLSEMVERMLRGAGNDDETLNVKAGSAR